MNQLPIEEYFTYHPPTTEERQQKHDSINESAISFARIIDQTVKDEDCRKMALFALQQARMVANQGVVVDELQSNLESHEKDVFL